MIPKEKSFRSAELFFFLYCKLRFHDKKKEYKDKKGLRHAFTENLKDFRRKCKKQLQNKMQMMT